MRVMVPDYAVDYLLPRLRTSDPSVELVPMAVDGSHPENVEDVEVLYKFFPDHHPPYSFRHEGLRRILAAAPGIRWIHSGKAGVEDMLIPELVESDIILTNGAGGPKLAIAENVLAFILADAKELHTHFLRQQQARWEYIPHRELPGMTVAILGLGKIGQETARLCKTLGMRVIGTKRRAEGSLEYVDALFPSSRQNECVADADYVVVAAALTPETRGMVNAATFQAMKPGAVVINIARGAVIDEPALVEALRAGKLKAAYLDVVTQEPLPPESPLWSMPNVVITPHNSHDSQLMVEHMAGVFIDNFARYCRGEPLQNVVDKRKGY